LAVHDPKAMKNYLVKSLYQVTDPDWKILDRSHEGNLFEKYITMHQMSVGSYTKFLQGDWELKFFTGKVHNINQAFEKTFWAIHNLWHSEPCNILYTDPDTLAIAPVNPWNQYQNFMMFNYTDPKKLSNKNVYNKSFDNFFNAGVRYFLYLILVWLGKDFCPAWILIPSGIIFHSNRLKFYIFIAVVDLIQE
jgi:hypothetical protein